MRRLINLRAMFVIAVSEIAAILLSFISYVWHSFGIILIGGYFVAIAVGIIVSYALRKSRIAAILTACLLLGVCTQISFTVQNSAYCAVEPNGDQVYKVEGSVDTVLAQDGTVHKISIADAKIDGKKISGKISIVFAEDNISEKEIPRGCKITVSGSLSSVRLISDNRVNGTAYRKNIRYTLYASYADAETMPHTGNIFIRVRVALHKRLVAACGDTYGSIAYCMLTGDKSELDETTVRMYSLSGIGHVLAVSGLHVGLLAGILLFLLRKMRVPRLAQVITVSAILAVYAAFVGFTASVLRACIMCVIAMLTLLNGERKDPLSSLCFAFTAILAVQPFLLFEVGFLLSFSAVFGLILFAPTFTKRLRKLHFPKFIAATLGATAAVHIGIFPVTAYFFGEVQTYSVVCNILLIPLLSVTFVFFVLTAPLSVLLHVNLMLRIGALGFAGADMLLGSVARLPLHSIYVNGNAWLFCFYPMYFLASRFFMLPRLKKLTSCSIMLVCIVLVVAPTLATLHPDREVLHSVIAVDSYGDVTSIVVDDGVTVIGDCKNTAALRSAMRAHHIRKIDTIILHALTENIGKVLYEFVNEVYVGKIICPIDTVTNEGLAALRGYKRFYIAEETHLPKLTQVRTKTDRHGGYLYAFSDEVQVLFMRYSARYTDIAPVVIDAAPVMRCFMYLNSYPDRIYLTNMPKGYLGEDAAHVFSLAEYGSFVFDMRDGSVLRK
ncbi:MAG: ComEC/Rec2 family competence protein [Clostridiales bacterium]|nr:ComEC/Rec2 family competence protein [Clostridiales bacterium]